MLYGIQLHQNSSSGTMNWNTGTSTSSHLKCYSDSYMLMYACRSSWACLMAARLSSLGKVSGT